MNQKLLHASNPFADPGDGTGAYNVYKVLYDAVANGLTEDDYSTTDWEGSKGMINNGEIACMVLGSWAVPPVSYTHLDVYKRQRCSSTGNERRDRTDT